MTDLKTIKRGFDKEVDTWNSLYGLGDSPIKGRYAFFQKNARDRTIKRMKLSIKLLNPAPGMKILDIGCGSGVFNKAIVSKGAYWVGTDVSCNMLIFGKKDSGNIVEKTMWVNGNGETLPFKDGAFDGILCIGMVNFLKKTRFAGLLNEMGKVLKTGGVIVFTSLRLDILTWVRSRLYPKVPLPVSSPGPIYPIHYKNILKAIDTSTFECVDMIHMKKYFGLPHYTIFKLLKK